MTSRSSYISFVGVLIFLFFSACQKDDEVKVIEVRGRVLNELTKKPVPDVTVSLNQSCGSSWSGGWSVIASVTTDKDGMYLFNTEVLDCSGWKVDINASPNYNSKFSTTWFSVQPNQKVNQTSYIYRNATLAVNAITNDPLSPDDDFFMNLPGIGCRCSGLTTERAKGDFYNTITWTVIRDSVIHHYSDSVYCPVDIVKTYTINY